MIKFFNKNSDKNHTKEQSTSEPNQSDAPTEEKHDPSIFIPKKRNNEGIIVSEPVTQESTSDSDKRNKKKERRIGPDERRINGERRINTKFSWKNFFLFSRRHSKRRKGPKDRRFGADRRLIKQLTAEEMLLVRNSKINNEYNTHKDPVPQTPVSRQAPEHSPARDTNNNTILPTTKVLNTPIQDENGTLVAEVSRTHPTSDDAGNNYIHIRRTTDIPVMLHFDTHTNEGIIRQNQKSKCSLGLIKSPDEIIHTTIQAETIIGINEATHRHIRLESPDGSDKTVNLAQKNQQAYFSVSLVLKNIGTNIEQLARNEVRFGKTTVSFDNYQIIEVLDENNHQFRLTGIAGERNLQQYLEQISSAQSLADDKNES